MTGWNAATPALIGSLARHASDLSVVAALILIAIGGYGLSRVPTGFLPIEDQGYLIAAVQLPDGAALDRTQKVLDKVSEIVGKAPGVAQVITIAGISALDNSASLANAGVAYIILKDWDARGPGEDLRSLVYGLNDKVSTILEARTLVLPPPPIQGIGNAAGFAMQVELRDGNSDYAKLQAITGAMVRSAQSQSALQRVQSPFRATRAAIRRRDRPRQDPDPARHHRPGVLGAVGLSRLVLCQPVQQVRPRVPGLHPGRTRDYRLTRATSQNMMVRNQNGDMIPIGTVAKITPTVGPSLISLYNLYPSATIVGLPAQGYSSGQSLNLMEEIADKTLPPGTGYEWTAMSYQEKAVSSQIYYVFGLAMLLVYLVLAGQYESWYAPISVILAVPLSLLGPMAVLEGLEDRQQPLCPDRPDPADRAVGQERDPDRRGRARAARTRASRSSNPRSMRRGPASARS